MKMIKRMSKKDLKGEVVILPITTDTSVTEGYEEVGYNAGVYGWNWSAYKRNNDFAWYVQGYRNLPKEN